MIKDAKETNLEQLFSEESDDPTYEPETCAEGESNGIECSPNWNGDSWICDTCGKQC